MMELKSQMAQPQVHSPGVGSGVLIGLLVGTEMQVRIMMKAYEKF
jgi:hypothetical protein